LLSFGRTNCFLLVHEKTRFPLFMIGLLKKDFAQFDYLFEDALMNTLLKIDANQQQLEKVGELLQPCSFTTDTDRSVLATMNQMKSDLEHLLWYDKVMVDDLSPYKTAAWLADRPCNVKGQKETVWPKQAILQLLSE
jgi:hypothetical protein